ncbi:uncharacterized protein N7515_003211 [Penicillium bovifimosum]|uniref:DNA 3'-5' helicase n=1 Tax=Penicillium bovifimosum TaxID=126998 RepID=A0A9W9H4D7_9EURO|nr:uncharacterized protein N7515_003211 [Penicillium bovifimosum]KAJ5138363.1 hypothetical protein N7515_003211 [Penicillium bovifimosum]
MRRNHQRYHSKPFQLPTQRRPNFPIPQSSRTGIIDQKLVEGSQQPRASSPSPRKPFNALPSSVHDEDPQLDDFDLELLASEHRENAFEDAGLSFPRSAPLRTSRQSEIDSPQLSRFFPSSTSITPSRGGNGTSSSDALLGPPSSPLALFRPRKNGSQPGQRSLGTSLERYLNENTQSSPQKLNTQDYPAASASKEQRQDLFSNIPPSVRGIVLVPVNDLPENHRSLFPFPLFNAIQSKSFHPIYNSNDNIVLSAPTGSGKTVVMELAICRLLNTIKDEGFKVVYQAPTKSLCSERFRDWHSKFSSLGLTCAELTGDTDHMQLRNVQSSQIIITTPEKWDSITRKWKDHMKLMQLVKLFLIDEVHILKEMRGATLEAVVSRMKNIGSNVRFVALSATVPNSEDIATWLGKDATNQSVPAHREHFGEEFRPVKLKKFVYGYASSLNDFAFDKVCGSKLPEIIGTHSCQKPIMIFCCTRNSSLATAKDLARLWTLTNPPARCWKGPQRRLEAHNEDLKTTLLAGVAFHHAGLGPADRHTIETGFRDGHISVICCTSTLAVGVNLPCQLVIIKNTVSWQDGGCKEYSDLEMMQMLGRAGRPQYDDSATAVILTRKARVAHYERLVQGSESLESCLHLNLIDHLNAEIGLGHISDVESAVKWLAGTFLFVRLRRNPTHYKLKEGANQQDEDELLRQICEKDIDLLRQCELVDAERLCSTQFGDAMARYYIQFETMKVLLSLKPKATLSETLEAIAQAQEFHEFRLKQGDKPLYREINRDPGIRFPIKVDLALQAHKVSLLIQSELGAIEFPDSEQLQKHKFTFQQEKSLVFAHVNRLIRCLIDCQIARGDSVAIRNALELARSFGAKVWDHSPLQMKQIEQVGVVAVRKLAAAGITSIEELECAEAHQIEMALSKNPPFGSKLLSRLKEFPKLRVAVKMVGKDVKNGSVNVRFRVEVAFMNDKTPTHFLRRPVYVCCLTERSDGHLIDFRRTSASKLQERLEIDLSADLTSAEQAIVCHVLCDDIGENSPTSNQLLFVNESLAGTSKQAELRPKLPSHMFAAGPVENIKQNAGNVKVPPQIPTARRDGSLNSKVTKEEKTNVPRAQARDSVNGNTESQPDISFDGDDLELDDFFISNKRCGKANEPTKSKDHDSDDIDWFSIDSTPPSLVKQVPKSATSREDDWAADMGEQDDEEYEPVRLANGKWACNHKCKDKTSCKHFCCREGLDKPPKPPKRTGPTTQKDNGLNQLTISASITKSTPVNKPKPGKELTGQRANKPKQSEHHPKAKKTLQPQVKRNNGARSTSVLSELDRNMLSLKRKTTSPVKTLSSDYGDDDFDDLPSPSELLGHKRHDTTRTDAPVINSEGKGGTEDDPVVEKENVDVTQSSLARPKPSGKDQGQTEPSTLRTNTEIIVIDDTPPCSAESPMLSDKGSPAEDSTVPPPSLKRKAGEDETQTEASPKRQKKSPSVRALQDHAQNALAEEKPLEPDQPISPVPWTGMDLTTPWDDGIDLLDEFKDIISFI